MPTLFDPQQFGSLPLWGQVLIAARMVRRGLLGMLPEATNDFRDRVMSLCGLIERCAMSGAITKDEMATLLAGRELRAVAPARVSAVAQAMWWAIDACRAAEAAQDFLADHTVTSSALHAIACLGEDQRVSRLQLTILVAADVDLIRFACDEVSIGRYDALTSSVLLRLAPVHGLTLVEVPKRAEQEAR